MRKKIIGVLVCSLLIVATVLPVAVTIKNGKINIENNESIDSFIINREGDSNTVGAKDSFIDTLDAGREEKDFYKQVLLKFFIFPDMYKFTSDYIDEIVEMVNEIYFCQWVNDIVFVWDRCNVTELPGHWLDHEIYPNDLLMRMIRNWEDCSHGINVVFVPQDYCDDNWNGICYSQPCHGVWASPTGGIKIRDTCNTTQMAVTLAHELLHALGLSHEQVKNSTALPVPPHAYGWVDPDGDCNPPYLLHAWDVDGDCDVDVADTIFLLWGSKDRTGTVISIPQYVYIWENVEKIPCTKKKSYKVPTSPLRASFSAFSMDKVLDAFDYVDITASMAINCYDQSMSYFILEVANRIPDTRNLSYGFYLNTDNDPETGSPDDVLPGADYLAAFSMFPYEYTGALWKWEDEKWIYVQALDWSMGEVKEDIIYDDSGREEYVGDVITINVPFESLNLTFEGEMQIRPYACDPDAEVVDLSPIMSISLDIVFHPLINTEPMSGSPGEIVIIYGSSFTQNADVTVEFNGVEVATSSTDNKGNFTATFSVPSVAIGYYYPVRAADDYGKHDLSIFYVEAPEDTTPPTVEITRPKERYLYLFDREIMPIGLTLIIGPIAISADAYDEESGINKVEFYIDDELKYTDYEEPYEWLWDETAFWDHRVKAIAYDNAGNSVSDEVDVFIFNI